MLNRKFFMRLGGNVRDKFRKQIFEDAINVKGRKFKGYKDPYKSQKQSNKLRRQDARSTGTTAPFVTGDLRNDFGLIKFSSTGFQVGFATRGKIVDGLNKKGRYITLPSQPFPKTLEKYMSNEVHKEIYKKLPNKTTRIKLFKK